MSEGARALLGEHDFRSFCVPQSAEKGPTVRTLLELELSRERELGEDILIVRVKASSFLHSMVRVLVGTLVEVGKGRRAPGWVADVLAARDRTAAGPTAPANGLTLWDVEYAEECWLEP
jgi:tRNA pseudouridine38-40 synthase